MSSACYQQRALQFFPEIFFPTFTLRNQRI
jgi:hypothetical protein